MCIYIIPATELTRLTSGKVVGKANLQVLQQINTSTEVKT